MTASRKHIAAAPLPASHAPGFFGATRLQSVLLAAVALLLYANTLDHQWALDDTIVITNNAFTQRGVAGLGEIFGKDTFAGYYKTTGSVSMVSGGRYRPLTLAVFAVLYPVFGKQPMPFHLLAVALFALVCLLLYRTLLLLLRDYRGPDYAVHAAWIATLLFIAHPIHTEIVDNIKGCDETVALLGSLGALYLTLKAFDTRRRRYSVAAAVSMFLGLMGKENAATFLVIVPLALVFFRTAKASKIAGLTTLPLVAFGGFVAIRAAVLPQLLSKPPYELLDNPYLRWTGDHWVDIAPSEKFATILYTLGKYVQLLVAPVTLTHDYYPRQIPLMRMSDPAVLASLALYVALAVYAGMGIMRGRRDLPRF